MNPYHTFIGHHTTFTLLIVLPELVLETLQYVDTSDITDLVGVIGLSLDMGVRFKASIEYWNRTETSDIDATETSDIEIPSKAEYDNLMNENEELRFGNKQLISEVQMLQQRPNGFMQCMPSGT